VGIEQLRALLPLIRRPVIRLSDRWYATASFVCACRELGCQALIRLKRNRKLYRAAPPRKEKQRGAPCNHGPLFQGTRPETSDLPMPNGKGSMSTASGWWSPVGKACISARRLSWKLV
jgi:hypothetical protein